jgi:hypothetical protein
MRPHHLPLTQLIHTMPRCQLDALLVVLQRLLDNLEQRICLVLVDAHVIADGEDDFANLFFLAVFVVLFVLIEADGDVDAGFGGPGLQSKVSIWQVDMQGFTRDARHGLRTSRRVLQNLS